MQNYTIARLPKIIFGSGTFSNIPDYLKSFGKNILFITGSQSYKNIHGWPALMEKMCHNNFLTHHETIIHEPSPEMIDKSVTEYKNESIDVVIAIGGGSALDAAKAIAGLLKPQTTVMDFLEGVGPELDYQGPRTPFFAIPTTAGTGSEATKNAVLSRQGKNGFKKSFRHDDLVADIAIIDPDLLTSCPPSLIAANGMDAVTQLMESYVSTHSNPWTDALAISALRAARDSLLAWYRQEGDQALAREQMAFASLNSGICLAQTGLGSVHGLASPLGAFFPIPHGVVCGTLVAQCTRQNILSMNQREPDNIALEKYATLGTVLCNKKFKSNALAHEELIQKLDEWTQEMQLPELSKFGIKSSDFDHIIKNCRGSSMKTNPIVLSDDEIKHILQTRL